MLAKIPPSAKFIFGFAAGLYVVVWLSFNIEGTLVFGTGAHPPEAEYKTILQALISSMLAAAFFGYRHILTSPLLQEYYRINRNKFSLYPVVKYIIITTSAISLVSAIVSLILSIYRYS